MLAMSREPAGFGRTVLPRTEPGRLEHKRLGRPLLAMSSSTGAMMLEPLPSRSTLADIS